MTSDKKRRKWPWVVGAVLLLLVVIGMSSGGGKTAQPGDASSAGLATSTPFAAQLSDPVATFGKPYDKDGLQLTATKPRLVAEYGSSSYCTTVTYANGSDEDKDFNGLDWKLLDSEGVEVSTNFSGGDKFLGSGSVRPKGKKTGDVCFDKQGAGTPTSVLYEGGLFSSPVTWR